MAKTPSTEEHALPSLSLVFGYVAVKDLQRLEDRVALLARLGYGNSEIAKICGTTSDTVSTLKARSKRTRTKKVPPSTARAPRRKK